MVYYTSSALEISIVFSLSIYQLILFKISNRGMQKRLGVKGGARKCANYANT